MLRQDRMNSSLDFSNFPFENYENVKKKRSKAAFDWSFVDERIEIYILKHDLTSKTFRELFDQMRGSYIPRKPADGDVFGSFILKTRKELQKFCKVFSQSTNIPSDYVARALYMQHIIYILLATRIITVPFAQLTTSVINEYLNETSKLSEGEFDLLFRGGIERPFSLAATEQLASVKLPRKTPMKALLPFPKKPKKIKNLSLTLSSDKSGKNVRHLSHSEGKASSKTGKSIETVRYELMDKWMQKDDQGEFAMDPILLTSIPKDYAISIDKQWYHLLELRRWIQSGQTTVPHNRRELTQAEIKKIMGDH